MTRKIVESTFVTLDGVISDPQVWGQPYWDEEHSGYAAQLMEPAEALLLGRETYEGFAEAWMQRSGDPFTDKFNSMPKYVASRGNPEMKWNATLLEGDAGDAVAELKEQDGGDVIKYGTGEFDRVLLERKLVDEYHFWMFPVVVGGGDHLGDRLDLSHLHLDNVTRFGSGIVVLTYSPPV